MTLPVQQYEYTYCIENINNLKKITFPHKRALIKGEDGEPEYYWRVTGNDICFHYCLFETFIRDFPVNLLEDLEQGRAEIYFINAYTGEPHLVRMQQNLLPRTRYKSVLMRFLTRRFTSRGFTTERDPLDPFGEAAIARHKPDSVFSTKY